MKVLDIALRSLILHSFVIHNVGAGTTAGTNATVTGAATVADARVSLDQFERGFVSDGSKRTYHEKLAQLPSTFLIPVLSIWLTVIASNFSKKMRRTKRGMLLLEKRQKKKTKLMFMTISRPSSKPSSLLAKDSLTTLQSTGLPFHAHPHPIITTAP